MLNLQAFCCKYRLVIRCISDIFYSLLPLRVYAEIILFNHRIFAVNNVYICRKTLKTWQSTSINTRIGQISFGMIP
jgi:hypothetical protein